MSDEIEKVFTIYWRDNKREVVCGTSVEDAFHKAGIGNGALPAVDFYAHGDNHEYEWNTETRNWEKIKKNANTNLA